MSKQFRSLTAKLYLFSFFDDFILIYPLYAVMFAHAGLSPYKITSLLIAWSLTGFVLEVPAGSIADKFPRRHVLLAGIALRVVGYSFWLLERNYFGFLVGFLLWGIKDALSSGTIEALVYDELKRFDKLSLYAKVTGAMQTYGLVAVVLASLGASGLARGGYSLILVLSISAVTVSAVAIYLLPKAPMAESANESGYIATMKQGLRAVIHRPKVLYIVSFMSIVAGLGSIDEYLGLFFQQKGFSNTGIAFWTAVIFTFGAAGSYFAHKLENRKLPVTLSLVGWAALLFLAAVSPKFVAPLLLGAYFMFISGIGVLFNAHLQKELSDDVRATATSVGGLSSEVFALLAFGVVSAGATTSGYTFAYQLVALATVVSALMLLLYGRAKKVVI